MSDKTVIGDAQPPPDLQEPHQTRIKAPRKYLDVSGEIKFGYNKEWLRKSILSRGGWGAVACVLLFSTWKIINPFKIYIFLFGIFTFTLPTINLCMDKFSETRPGIILNPGGIRININTKKGQFLQWSEISGFRTYDEWHKDKVQKQIIVIDTFVETEYPYPRSMFERNVAGPYGFGSPYYIYANFLSGTTHDELLELCNAYLARYGKAA